MSALYNIFRDAVGVSTDSRTIESGQLFFALSGQNFNGNLFAKQALDRGAIAVVVDEEISENDKRVIRVENSLESLQTLSTEHRKTLGTTCLLYTSPSPRDS